MSNTISDAISAISTDASITIDTTHASSAVKINHNQQSQTTRVDMIKQFLQYGDHLAYINVNDSKLYLVDIITGITPALDYSTSESSFKILESTGQITGRFVSRFIAEFNIKLFNDGGTNGRPGLIDTPISLASSATKYTGGEEQVIRLMSEPTDLSGGDVIYSYTDINTVLGRKKTLHESTNVDLELDGLHDIQRGQRLTFDNSWDDRRDTLKASGSFTVLEVSYNTKNTTTRLSGIGTFVEV